MDSQVVVGKRAQSGGTVDFIDPQLAAEVQASGGIYDEVQSTIYVSQQNLQRHGSALARNDSSRKDAAVTEAVNRMNSSMYFFAQALAFYYTTPVYDPDGRAFSRVDMMDLLSRLQFELVDTNFGPGRAGENVFGEDGLIHIRINVNQFVDYSNLTGGVAYLITHEIAHASIYGQAANQNYFQNWLAATPSAAGLNPAEQRAQHASSDQFFNNEVWANNFAKSMATYRGEGTLPNPTYGYIYR